MTQPGTPDPGKDADRLRQHPEARFAPPEHLFDLRAEAQALLNEIADPQRTQRQKTLYRQGRATIALFVFEAGAEMPSHRAAGVVTINVLEGRLRIGTPQGQSVLDGGQFLILGTSVEHSVHAEQRSIMLLQVHLDEPAASKE